MRLLILLSVLEARRRWLRRTGRNRLRPGSAWRAHLPRTRGAAPTSGPESHSAASTPANTSPAPVVSTGFTAGAGTSTLVGVEVPAPERRGWSPDAVPANAIRALRLVDDDDVGDPGQRLQARSVGAAGDALTTTTVPGVAGRPGRGQRRLEGISSWNRTTSPAATMARGPRRSTSGAVGARRHDDGVLAAASTDDHRGAAGSRQTGHAVEIPIPLALRCARSRPRCRVVAEAATRWTLAARAGRRDGLIAALAARRGPHRRGQHAVSPGAARCDGRRRDPCSRCPPRTPAPS